MNLYHLKYFFDAAQGKSTTRAAKLNHVTQSAISQAIKSLETYLGKDLTYHQRNRFELTEAGEIVYRHCETIFNSVEKLQDELSESEENPVGKITLATTNSLALTYMSETLSRFSKKYPGIDIVLKLGNSDQVKDYLHGREADFGIILEDDQMGLLNQHVIDKGRFCLVAHQQMKLKNLNSDIIVTRENKIEVEKLREQFKKKLKMDIRLKMEVFSWELIRQLCLNEAGVGYVPEYLIKEDLKNKKLKNVFPEVQTWDYKVVLITTKSKKLGRIHRLLTSEMGVKNTINSLELG
jgi:DNA-binding transcriptional LysR family regulator